MSVLVMTCHQTWPQQSDKEPSPSEVNASTFDVGLPTFVIEIRAFKSFGRDRNNVFLSCIFQSELWLNRIFPFTLHDISDAGLAEFVPLAT